MMNSQEYKNAKEWEKKAKRAMRKALSANSTRESLNAVYIALVEVCPGRYGDAPDFHAIMRVGEKLLSTHK